MNVGKYFVENKVISWLIILIMLGGGLYAFNNMGKLEDPAFTIKSAKIITRYPGATAQEVQEELTYHLEDAIQKLPQVKRIKMSVSRPGLSDILIDFKDEYKAPDLPNIFDELRRKVQDVRPKLPPGAMEPMVIDDFGDVYGIYVAIYGDGYSYAELKEYADLVRRELLFVQDVGKIMLYADLPEKVYVEISRARIAQLGVSPQMIYASLSGQNLVTPAGRAEVDSQYIRIQPTGELTSVEEIGDLLILQDDATATKR